MYVERGLRWIPGYRVTLDGQGTARVELQATLVNELADLDAVTAHLVVGVPRFAFADTPDPIGLQDQLAPLGPYFQSGGTGHALGAALLTQARMSERGRDYAEEAGIAAPELTGGEQAEDLFIFTIDRLTLKRGDRMVVPLVTAELAYEDIFKLDLPIAPPSDVLPKLNSQQQLEIARLLERARVRHVLRLTNGPDWPITTAPALIMLRDRVLAQGLISYAPPGATADLEVTDAMDIRAKHTEREIERRMDDETFAGSRFHRTSNEGLVELTNGRDRPVRVEVTRYVLGHIDELPEGVEHEATSIFSDDAFGHAALEGPWWRSYSWPWWWLRVNGIQKLTWNSTVGPGETASMRWTWHYLWQ
jgi:hypothetical protein